MTKKICFVVYNFADFHGLNSIVSELANELSDRYEVTIVSIINDGRENAFSLTSKIKYKSLLTKANSLRKDLFHVFKPSYRYFKKEAFDVIFLEGYYSGLLLSGLQMIFKSEFIFVDHGALMNQLQDRKVTIMRFWASKLCRRTITLTERNRIDYIHKFHLPEEKVKCIYNWIDLKKQKTINYNIHSKKIISVGRFGKEKGFDQLIEAFSIVVKKHPDWQLDIYGDGETMPLIKEMIQEKNIENNVHLPGMKRNVMERYPDYAMYVLPSYREGFALVLLEAKLNKLPIVSFDIIAGPGEIIRDPVDGLLIPPKDINAMAEAICYLIENDDVREAMSKRALDNMDKFSKEIILKEWIAICEQN